MPKHPFDQPIGTSRTFWVGILAAAASAFLSAMAASPDGLFPAWLRFLCGALASSASVVTIMLRVSDGRAVRARQTSSLDVP